MKEKFEDWLYAQGRWAPVIFWGVIWLGALLLLVYINTATIGGKP